MSDDPALPADITAKILHLSPATTIGRFKSVSKEWNSLISDPQFIKNHLDRLQTTAKLLLVSDTNSLLYSLDTNQLLPYLNSNKIIDDNDDVVIPATVEELSFGQPPIRWSMVLGSCNGLVLIEDVKRSLYLINPTTRGMREIPPFAFPDEVDFVKYGFSYESTSDDYKVFLLYWASQSELDVDDTGTFFSVYSLRNNSWKKLPKSSYAKGVFHAVVNQNFHWCVNARTIVAFSFKTEEFSSYKLEFLDSYDDIYEGKSVGIYDLIDIGGKLGVLISLGDVYELWVMKDYGVADSWTQISPHQFQDPLLPVCLVQGSNRDMVLDNKGDILIFNMDERRCRNVRIEGAPGRFSSVGSTFSESLESPARTLGP